METSASSRQHTTKHIPPNTYHQTHTTKHIPPPSPSSTPPPLLCFHSPHPHIGLIQWLLSPALMDAVFMLSFLSASPTFPPSKKVTKAPGAICNTFFWFTIYELQIAPALTHPAECICGAPFPNQGGTMPASDLLDGFDHGQKGHWYFPQVLYHGQKGILASQDGGMPGIHK